MTKLFLLFLSAVSSQTLEWDSLMGQSMNYRNKKLQKAKNAAERLKVTEDWILKASK